MMVLSNKSDKECVSFLKKITPPELHKSIGEMYTHVISDFKNFKEEEQHMLNSIWLEHVHGTKYEDM